MAHRLCGCQAQRHSAVSRMHRRCQNGGGSARPAPDLDRLNDLGGVVACQREACGAGVQLHGSPQCLLCASRHAGRVVWCDEGVVAVLVSERLRRQCRTLDHCTVGAHLSASSSTMILCFPGGSVTFFCANILIFSRTTEIPLCRAEAAACQPSHLLAGRAHATAAHRSSDAFSSCTALLYASPSSARAKHVMLVVFPVPGGPAMMMLGMLPSAAMIFRRSTMSALPTMSSSCTREHTHG